MTEIEEGKETGKREPLSLSRPGRLEIKKTVGGGQVRQNFSHGRSKVVTVEVRKKRTYALDSGGRMAEVSGEAEILVPRARLPSDAGTAEEAEDQEIGRPAGVSLTVEEKAARVRALQDAQKVDEQAEPEIPGFEPEPVSEEDQAEAERLATEEAERKRREDEATRLTEETEARLIEEQAKAAASAAAAKLEAHGSEKASKEEKERGRRAQQRRMPTGPRRGEPRRRAGKLTISEVLGGREERSRSLASVKRAREKQKQQQQLIGEPQKIVRLVTVPETISVQELANRMAERGTDVIRALMKMDVMVGIDQVIEGDIAELIAAEFGHTVKRVSESDVELGLRGRDDEESEMVPRAPVVTIMGHVDHGKTSLLDALRKTDVVSGEAGGITQHIGAYQVNLSGGAVITFIDTPGHEAFTQMRARGASVTDIVVLVVAADDGVMPQTVEAVHHARAAGVPVVVAINKMDKPGADAHRVRTTLLQHEIVVEEMGGDILSVEVSAKEGTNLDKLVEAILLQSEILDLKANADRPAEGVIIEARIERGRGTVATLLVQRGTLELGDILVAGAEWGRVRELMDDTGESVRRALPAMPVEAVGLNAPPAAGDDFIVVESEGRAREVSEFRRRKQRQAKITPRMVGDPEDIFSMIMEGKSKQLPVVVKGDTQGSVEAIVGALEKMSTDEVMVSVLHSAVGGINESDVTLARASRASIIGFEVRANPQAREMARREGLEIRYYSVIYDIVDDFRKALTGMLEPMRRERLLGYAEIRKVFNISKVGRVAGCMVTEGSVRRGARVRLVRDQVVIHEGSLSQLKRFKDDAKEVKEGYDCGMTFENYNDLREGDVIECFEIEEVAREL